MCWSTLRRALALTKGDLALLLPCLTRPPSFNPPQAHSLNLIDWRIATTVLVPNDGLSWEQSLWYTGYQYAGGEAAGRQPVPHRCFCVCSFGQWAALGEGMSRHATAGDTMAQTGRSTARTCWRPSAPPMTAPTASTTATRSPSSASSGSGSTCRAQRPARDRAGRRQQSRMLANRLSHECLPTVNANCVMNAPEQALRASLHMRACAPAELAATAA